MSGASERANGRASGPVLQSVFLAVIDHSVLFRRYDTFIRGLTPGPSTRLVLLTRNEEKSGKYQPFLLQVTRQTFLAHLQLFQEMRQQLAQRVISHAALRHSTTWDESQWATVQAFIAIFFHFGEAFGVPGPRWELRALAS